MKTLARARENYDRAMANVGGDWKAGVQKGRYCERITQFLGGRPSGMCAHWDSGVNAVSAGDFQASVSGKGGAWEEGLRRKIG